MFHDILIIEMHLFTSIYTYLKYEQFLVHMCRHHIYEKHGGPKSLELKEIGPRFELRLYQVNLREMQVQIHSLSIIQPQGVPRFCVKGGPKSPLG